MAQGTTTVETPSSISARSREHYSFEFHFQEVFTGEQIKIITHHKVQAQIVARTKFQTGLAHIETLELADKEEVTLLIEELNLELTFEVDAKKPFLAIRMADGNLQVDYTATRPGYL